MSEKTHKIHTEAMSFFRFFQMESIRVDKDNQLCRLLPTQRPCNATKRATNLESTSNL